MRDHPIKVLPPPSPDSDPRRDLRAVLAFGLASAVLAFALSALGYSVRSADQVQHRLSGTAVSAAPK
jgi:hydrogenase/urease accessory protein HupE